ncbi:MAG: hypothetical protein RIC56_18530 [Pseudomonadales bacterium]
MTLSNLLALRDGEVDAVADVDVAADGDAAAQLAQLRALKAELNALPPVTPDAGVWRAIQERAGQRQRSWLQRFPLATAASVFVAAALSVMLLNSSQTPEPGGAQLADAQPGDPLAQLIQRSQRLESELLTPAVAPAGNASSSEQALRFGIADVDAQLNELFETTAANPADRERLWQDRERLWGQRVMLLEALADVQRGQAVLQPAIY